MDKKRFFTGRDYFYWIAILIGWNILLLTSDFGANEEIISYVSFAGTITSIILAVVALLYSFIFNEKSSGAIEKFKSSAENIEKHTNELKNVSESIEKWETTINNQTRELEQVSKLVNKWETTILDVEKRINKKLDEQERTNERIRSVLEDAFKKQSHENNSKIEEEVKNKYNEKLNISMKIIEEQIAELLQANLSKEDESKVRKGLITILQNVFSLNINEEAIRETLRDNILKEFEASKITKILAEELVYNVKQRLELDEKEISEVITELFRMKQDKLIMWESEELYMETLITLIKHN